MEERIINVWQDADHDWIEYYESEMKEYFNFVTAPNWSKVKEMYLNNASCNKWLRVVFFNGEDKIYNSVYGTYVEM